MSLVNFKAHLKAFEVVPLKDEAHDRPLKDVGHDVGAAVGGKQFFEGWNKNELAY